VLSLLVMLMTSTASESLERGAGIGAFAGGMGIGTLGGLIGLGGAEFRLPLLIGMFRFGPLEAVIVNKAMSLIVVATALPFRAGTTSFAAIADQWTVIVNLLAGSLLGAWVGASWATRLRSETLYRVIAVLLVAIAAVLMVGHGAEGGGHPLFVGPVQIVAGIGAGFVIGVVTSLLGVDGGELLIPTLILLFGADVEAGGQPVPRGQSPDNACRLRPLQPGQHLRRPAAQSVVRGRDGGRLDRRQLRRCDALGNCAR
jgi:uncharacterized membrane protein YfcA